MLFEQITNKMFNIESLSDELVFFYCILLASNPDDTMTFDEFMDSVDDNPTLLVQFQQFLADEASKRNVYGKVEDNEKKKSLTVTEIYQTLVIQCGISPDYVLDAMQMYEVQPLIQAMHLKHRDSWEQSRMIAYIIAQVNSRKKLSPTDIVRFVWDDNKETGISNEDIERLRQKAKEYSRKNK